MEAKVFALQEEPSRRKLSQEMLALCAWSLPDQDRVCDLSKLLEAAPACARKGLALWLKDAALREANRSDPEMNPERFPQRRSTRLMIPHTAGNSDRVQFALRLPEPGLEMDAALQNPSVMGTRMTLSAVAGASSSTVNTSAYQVALHGERRARRESAALRAPLDEITADYAGVPAPAWIVAHGSGSESK